MQRRTFLAASAAALGLAQALRHTGAAMADSLPVRAEHPRLLLSSFDPTRELIATDTTAAGWYAGVKQVADDLLAEPVSEYVIPDGKRLLATSRETVHRVYTLSLAYAVEGETEYRDRLWAELEAVCAFPDWNHQRHFLDVGEMTHAVAIGYDWWYEEWTSGQRSTMETALLEYGLNKGLDVYAGKPTPLRWNEVVNNWNIVCNGGMIVGALAVADRYPEVAQQILTNALESLPLAVGEYAPDGGYPEGGGYWEYATKYLVLLMAALQTATGDEDLSAEPGLDTTVDFPMQLTGPTGAIFNYYDSGASSPAPAEVFWMAQRYQRPDYGWWAQQGADVRAPSWSQLPLGLLWYDPEQTTGPIEAGTELDAYFSRCEVAMMRSGWERDDAVYIAGKAGDNTTNHGDLDIGTFVYEALGQRWFTELGSDDYNLDAYFGSLRWTYYRKRGEGQNTVLINPGKAPDQDPEATGTIVDRDSGQTAAWMIADGTATHPALTSWRRGWRLFDHRQQVVIQDEISLSEPCEVWWFAHTAANVEVSDDGRSATLTLSGKKLLARIAGSESARFVLMDPWPLWTSPDPDGQNANAGLGKLAIRMQEVTDLQLAVQLTPLYPGVTTPVIEPVARLSSWTTGPKSVATLRELRVDGQPLDGFAATNFSYGVDLSGSPEITAVPTDSSAKVKIKSGSADGAAMITVTQPGKATGIYRLWSDTPLGLGNFLRTVLTSSDDGNVGENTMDGNPDTRWSAEGDGEWIAYDMGGDGPVESIQIAWYSGDQRSTDFDIEVAPDGATDWTTVFTGSSAGDTTAPETYSFDATTARYLRIVGHGNSSNEWNSITEVVIDGRNVEIDRPNVLQALKLSVPEVPLGGAVEASVTGTMTDGSEADLGGLEFSYVSTDPQIAEVSDDGTVTGVAEGLVEIAVITETSEHRLLHARAEVNIIHPDRPRFGSVADSYVRDGAYADNNFGSEGTAFVKQAPDPDSGYNRTAFLAFEPEQQTRPVEQVLLNIYVEVADNNGTEIDLVACPAGEFDETTLTWNTQPEIGEAVGTTHATSEPSWCQIDVTAVVADSVAQGKPVHLAVVQDEPDSDGLATRISTRESDHVPYLQAVLGPA